jgi:heat shock protein HslJ
MRITHLATLALLLLTVAGCGSSDPQAAAESTTPATTAPTPATATPTTVTTPPTTSGTAGAGPSSQDTRELTGIRWMLEGFITVGGPDPVPAGIEAALTFDDVTHVRIETGCNQGSARVTLGEGGTITFGPVALTKMACSDEHNKLEARIVNLLGLPSYWSAHDGTLSIYPATVADTGMLFRAG